MSDRRWTHSHPDGPRLDVNGVAWFACDPYPTWYRWGNSGLVIASPRFPKPAPTGEERSAMGESIYRAYSPSRNETLGEISADRDRIRGVVGTLNQGVGVHGGLADWVVQRGAVAWGED